MTKPSESDVGAQFICHVCGHAFPRSKIRSWIFVLPGVSDLIARNTPDWGEGKYICKSDLTRFRRQYVEKLLMDEQGELNELDRQVIDSLEAEELVSRNTEDEIAMNATFGERTADKVATFGGSWAFILSFGLVLIVWIALNIAGLLARPFDPYPFILLNLVLSCLAAIQAPVILMSQRRQETKDRLRAENDYRVNLKAELEIRQLHEKIDHQLVHQWKKLAELQQIQIQLLEEKTDRHR